MKPVFQATALKAAREELSKAIAIIERTKWERTTYLTKNLAACPESSEAPESGQTTRSLVHINLSAGMKDAKRNLLCKPLDCNCAGNGNFAKKARTDADAAAIAWAEETIADMRKLLEQS